MNKYAELAAESRANRRRARMCDRKRGYATEAEAVKPGARHYKCPFCGLWHRSESLMRQVRKAARRA